MIVSEGRLGRVFVLRLGDGDRLPDAIEDFARTRGVEAALVAALGGLENGRLVTGPEDGRTMPPTAMLTAIDAVHEAAAVGTLFPGPDGTPRLHMHAALGRAGETKTGCVRPASMSGKSSKSWSSKSPEPTSPAPKTPKPASNCSAASGVKGQRRRGRTRGRCLRRPGA